MSSPSLRPLIDTCQKCSTSPANHEPRSPANGGFQNPGVCPQAVPSFSSPIPTVLFLALAPFSAQAKHRKPRSSVFLCSQTLRKRLLRRLGNMLKIYFKVQGKSAQTQNFPIIQDRVSDDRLNIQPHDS